MLIKIIKLIAHGICFFYMKFKDQTYNLENCIVDAISFQDLEAILKIVLVKTCL